ncbi:hypothetical protein FGE12_23270 [Aggregicoccus sp. 17bor-14]|uniref:hypothetical protein n=1 Tax=Myxococcaceae TaxID=31 RepID=UPI00129CC112|nr:MULTISPECIES: hypothetical protein [Myxococcaceae]MBF5045345.1 hypothetical protein [Simulacricoccus sp. 17bor-14]MRI91087.1 hypothetical protein [Aggregicoccus sp. 17bor-14]
MRPALLLLLWLPCMAGCHHAPESKAPKVPQPTPAEACAVTACRPPHTVTVVLDETREMRQELPPFPYVYKDVIYVVPGDDFRVTGDIEGDRWVHLRYVPEGEAAPPHALRIRFGQEGAEGGARMMVLSIESTLPRALKYTALMLPAEANAFAPTSSCPVLAGRAAFESWSQPLRTLVMDELRLVDLPPGAETRCQ